MTATKKHFICRTEDLLPGRRSIVQVGSRRIGVFNVEGRFHALLNVCPHAGGNLCDGVVCGTNQPVSPAHGYVYEYGQEGGVLRCPWHGWEFEINGGRCLSSPTMRAKCYNVVVEDECVYVIA